MKMEYAKKLSIRDFTLYNIGLGGYPGYPSQH
jgi:hypothetical protein